MQTMPKSITIQKKPVLTPASDYALLRGKGLEYIQALGSRIWTDYNIHDPGITLLEALCYAISDLGFRTSLDIKDLLAEPINKLPEDQRQAFFTAREILTINPWTSDDFRKMLINIDGIKNGWLHCKTCPCEDFYLFANCAKDKLQYEKTERPVIIKGLYDVLVEFEDQDKSGNLNSGKIKYNFSYLPSNSTRRGKASAEMRLPSWARLELDKPKYKLFRNPNSLITSVDIPFISGNKGDVADIPKSPDNVLDNALRKSVFAPQVIVTFKPDKDQLATATVVFEEVPINIWFRSSEERRGFDDLKYLKKVLTEHNKGGILPNYLEKIKNADKIIARTKLEMHSSRNLAEDYCSINAIEVDDIGVCLDMVVEPSADIEAILGEAYYLIDQYFSPDIKFYSLQQLLDEKVPVDEIFEGPSLSNGFIRNNELAAASLRTSLYSSDVINFLMDLPGVISVNNFVFTRFNDDGRLVQSEQWVMPVGYNRQPRLYIEASKVLVYKNGLPFLADKNELLDTLHVIKGKHSQPKFSVIDNDLKVPRGDYYNLSAYYPVQHSLPLTYGTGYDGLPGSASDQRKAQAKQLKAYLLFFEQLLVNYLAQLSNIKELFAVDETVDHSYFSRFIGIGEISGLSDLYKGLDGGSLQGLIESNDVFSDRRNRFLDHLLARFAENFNDYALMLYSYNNDKQVTDNQLIKNKVSFIQNFPKVSSNRAKAFNYKVPAMVCINDNVAGLIKRVQLLLGYGKPYLSYLTFVDENSPGPGMVDCSWKFTGESPDDFLQSVIKFSGSSKEKAEHSAASAFDEVFSFITKSAFYEIKNTGKFILNLHNDSNILIAAGGQQFNTQAEAEKSRDALIAFASKLIASEQICLVEHLLLRPRNKPGAMFKLGDPLLSVCLPKNCQNCCGEDDPYSFRITLVLNGEDGLANKGMEFRHFADQTIRMEAPAHLGIKICWVSKKQLIEFQSIYCKWLGVLALPEPDPGALHSSLIDLINLFGQLKNVYPQASLHDCIDGNDDNRIFLGHTAVISDEELDQQIKNKKNK